MMNVCLLCQHYQHRHHQENRRNHENWSTYDKYIKWDNVALPYALRCPWTMMVVPLYAHITVSTMESSPLHYCSTFLTLSKFGLIFDFHGRRQHEARVEGGYEQIGTTLHQRDHCYVDMHPYILKI